MASHDFDPAILNAVKNLGVTRQAFNSLSKSHRRRVQRQCAEHGPSATHGVFALTNSLVVPTPVARLVSRAASSSSRTILALMGRAPRDGDASDVVQRGASKRL